MHLHSNIIPLVVRELRAASRQQTTYGMRILGCCLGTSIVAWVLFFSKSTIATQGIGIFNHLSFCMILGTSLLTLLTLADCISREKREGTLPLLFLAPLKSTEILLAKSLAGIMRIMNFTVALFPCLLMPLLLGGLDSKSIFLVVLGGVVAFVHALAASLMASSLCVHRNRAMVCALLFFVVFLGLTSHIWFTSFLVPAMEALSPGRDISVPWGFSFVCGPIFLSNFEGVTLVALSTRGLPTSPLSLFMGYGFFLMLSLLWLLLTWSLAARTLNPTERQRSAFSLWWDRALNAPVIGIHWHKQGLRWLLARNPVLWLFCRSASGRMSMLGYLAVVILLGTYHVIATSIPQNDFIVALIWGLIAVASWSAASSFQAEQETGVMELLFVTPLKLWTLVGGRIASMTMQILPAILLVIVIHFALIHIDLGGFPYEMDHLMQFSLGWLNILILFCGLFGIGMALALEGVPVFLNVLVNLITTVFAAFLMGYGFQAYLQSSFQPDGSAMNLSDVNSQVLIASGYAALFRLCLTALGLYFCWHNLSQRCLYPYHRQYFWTTLRHSMHLVHTHPKPSTMHSFSNG